MFGDNNNDNLHPMSFFGNVLISADKDATVTRCT